MMPMIEHDAILNDRMIESTTVPGPWAMIVFIISYFVVVVWTMLPIVVAILLESFTNASRQQQLEDEHVKMHRAGTAGQEGRNCRQKQIKHGRNGSGKPNARKW